MKRYLKNKSFLTGAILAFIMLGMLVVSLFWLPYDPEEMYLAPKLSLPSISHLMGTDQFGDYENRGRTDGISWDFARVNADVYIWTRFKQYDSGIVNHVHSAFCTYGAKRIFKAS